MLGGNLNSTRRGSVVVWFWTKRFWFLRLLLGINVVFKQRTGVSHTSIPRGGEVQGIGAQVSLSFYIL